MSFIYFFISFWIISSDFFSEPLTMGIEQRQPYFTLMQASAKTVLAGARGGAKITHYTFEIRILQNTDLSFDSVWVNNKNLKLQMRPTNTGSTTLGKGDTIVLTASDYVQPDLTGSVRKAETEKSATENKAKPPVDFEGLALLQFNIHSKPNYYVIKEIKVLPTIYGQ